MAAEPTDEDCIFCRIVAGEIPSRIVHETDDVLAFLDANPLAPGHTLVVPKAHHGTFADTPTDLAEEVFDVLYDLTPVVEEAVDADASNVAFNNGSEAGQEIPHLHGHIIPRFSGDGGNPIHAIVGSRPDLSDEELDEITDTISTNA